MADLKLEGPDLKKMVKLGKKKTLSFAFCPGAKNEHTMLIDRRKGPEMLGKLARKEGGSPKVAFGTFEVKGRTMEMTCGRVVPQMAKVVKKYLKSQKTLVNVVILDEDGNTLDSDVEDLAPDPTMDAIDDVDDVEAVTGAATPTEPSDAKPEQDDTTEGTGADAAALVARIKALQPGIAAAEEEIATKLKQAVAVAVSQIKSAALEQADKSVTMLENAVAKLGAAATAAPAPEAPDFRALATRANTLKESIADLAAPAKDKLMTALASAVQQIKERNHDDADALLGRIEAAINKTSVTDGNGQPTSEEAEKWRSALARLTPAVDSAMENRQGDLAAINRIFDAAKNSAEKGDFKGALVAASKTAELLKQARSMSTTAAAQEAADTIAEGVVQLRTAWIETRLGMRKEIEGLKSAIDKATAGIEGLEDVPSRSGVLFDYIDDIDTDLEKALQKLAVTPDGKQRETLKKEARGIVDTYMGVLDNDFFRAVDDNGFVKTNIRNSALNSLKSVSTALAS